MALRRYNRTKIMGLGRRFGTSRAIPAIRENIANGNIRVEETFLQDGERLDTIAGREYGDGRHYWLIAAASNIGFVSQVPPGTRILIPNLEDASELIQ